jgi:hypothetical protein
MALFSVVTLVLSPRRLEQHDAVAAPPLPDLSPRHLFRYAAGFADSEFAFLLYLAVAGHFYAAAWSEHNELLAALFSIRIIFYYWQSDSKFERMNNPWFCLS